jgi:hypothetical protein
MRSDSWKDMVMDLYTQVPGFDYVAKAVSYKPRNKLVSSTKVQKFLDQLSDLSF